MLLLGALAGCAGTHATRYPGEQVVGVETENVPQIVPSEVEAYTFASSFAPGAAASFPLEVVRRYVPASLPPNPPQHCGHGARVVFQLTHHRKVVYGPCKLPGSVARLREAMLRAANSRGTR